jgi:hypothetical protein
MPTPRISRHLNNHLRRGLELGSFAAAVHVDRSFQLPATDRVGLRVANRTGPVGLLFEERALHFAGVAQGVEHTRNGLDRRIPILGKQLSDIGRGAPKRLGEMRAGIPFAAITSWIVIWTSARSSSIAKTSRSCLLFGPKAPIGSNSLASLTHKLTEVNCGSLQRGTVRFIPLFCPSDLCTYELTLPSWDEAAVDPGCVKTLASYGSRGMNPARIAGDRMKRFVEGVDRAQSTLFPNAWTTGSARRVPFA